MKFQKNWNNKPAVKGIPNILQINANNISALYFLDTLSSTSTTLQYTKAQPFYQI
ncbi:hypothetical protein FM107_12395 [Sphingobacterium sp. JB170]|nr:hypothetical protein FM107_12395 [Sphingobacterium sp. JB170]